MKSDNARLKLTVTTIEGVQFLVVDSSWEVIRSREFSVPECHTHIGCWTCIKTLISLYFHVFTRLNKSTNLKERLNMTFKSNPANEKAFHTR